MKKIKLRFLVDGVDNFNSTNDRHTATIDWRASICDTPRFSSCKGSNELFMWYARYGNSGRIHLRFDASTYEVEIGYIGPHLPF